MNEFLVSTDSMGVIHLYDCNFQRPGPDRSWHGFRSYQDLSDFFTFALRGPAPVNVHAAICESVIRMAEAEHADLKTHEATFLDEITKESTPPGGF